MPRPLLPLIVFATLACSCDRAPNVIEEVLHLRVHGLLARPVPPAQQCDGWFDLERAGEVRSEVHARARARIERSGERAARLDRAAPPGMTSMG